MAREVQRTSFSTNRQLEFFSVKELTTQTGHPEHEWPLVIVKELVDNGLDACEEAGVQPEIEVVAADDGITVIDNGPGLPPEAVAGICDYSVRVSSREAYVAPDRGAQGNALKTLIAMPYVLSNDKGRASILACGLRHNISVSVDRIAQQPVVQLDTSESTDLGGTSVTIEWPTADSASSILLDSKDRILQMVADYAVLNPHATFRVDCFGETRVHTATDPSWRKWRPSDPTCCHWYGVEHFERLLTAHLSEDRQKGRVRTVREFISQFQGLSSTRKQKAVLDAVGLSGANLEALVAGDDLDQERIAELLRAMQSAAKPVSPARLGVLGKEHLRESLRQLGAEVDSSFQYRKKTGVSGGAPWVAEAAFAFDQKADRRRLIAGVNWSPAIHNPFRRLGPYGPSLDELLEEQRAGGDEPVVVLVHLASAQTVFADRGKSAVITN